MNRQAEVNFFYDGEPLRFISVSNDDHILETMRAFGTFYEKDVLERLRGILKRSRKQGCAVDAGAFIGTHSVYFARFCSFTKVIAFEPNLDAFGALTANLGLNNVADRVVAVQAALGDTNARASILAGPKENLSASRVEFRGRGEGTVEVSTVDGELERLGVSPVSLVKIDVEGLEAAVLDGAKKTIARDRPILSVEVHGAGNLFRVVRRLLPFRYAILDCCGMSPTYILEPSTAPMPRLLVSHGIWIVRAALPDNKNPWHLLKWYLRRLAERALGRAP